MILGRNQVVDSFAGERFGFHFFPLHNLWHKDDIIKLSLGSVKKLLRFQNSVNALSVIHN